MSIDLRKRAGSYSRQSRASRKSIEDQAAENRAAADREGWRLAAEYADGASASRFARKVRDDWARLLDDIKAGALDVLILWESSRGDRTPETWFALLATCRDKGVLIHVVTHYRTYDMNNPRDWRTLAEDGVDNAYESEKISLRVRRGHASAAALGRPSHGRTPYGYRRVYDQRTGALLGQEPDPETAPVVRNIITKAAQNVPINQIVRELNAAGIPSISGGPWYRVRVRDVAINPAYAAIRVYNGQTYPALWEPLVPPDVFWAAQRVLSDPARVTRRPGSQKHLLSYLAICDPCGARLFVAQGRYKCYANTCVTIVQAAVDELVTRLILDRLSRPDAYAKLSKEGADADRAVMDARAEVDQLRVRLDEFRLSAARGETSPASLAVIEADLAARIRTAERQAEHAAMPPAIRQILEPGADVSVRWDAAPLAARREVIRTMVEIRIGRNSVRGGRRFEPQRLGPSRWVGDDLTWAELGLTLLSPGQATI